MKRLALLICLLTASAAASKTLTPTFFYGVDFSLVQVAGTDETPAQFAVAFERINDLFVSEAEKYRIGKFTRRPVAGMHLSVAKQAAKAAFAAREAAAGPDTDFLLCGDPAYDCLVQIDRQVAGYQLPQSEGTGMVLVANLLDKTRGRGSFYLVVFDIATRRIEECTPLEGKCGGFGLRNFWANAVYQSLKSYYRKH